MFENVGRSVVLLGGVAGLTLCLAGGVAVGVVPQAGGSAAAPVQTAATATAAASDVGASTTPETVPTTVAPEAPAPPDSSPVAGSRPAAATEAATSSPDEQSPVAPVADTPAPAEAAGNPRLNPSSAQVQAAMAQMRARVPLYSPTEAQARDFGNQVCDALDQGQSVAQVQATALATARRASLLVPVSATDVNFAVAQAVQLFCPTYSSQL